MAGRLADLTNVNPWEAENRGNQQAFEQNQRTWDRLQTQLGKAAQRRSDLNARNQALRDREYEIANESTSKLLQPQTNNKFTDLQLQQLGQGFKQEYYDAIKQYEASDKGDEAKQAFEEAKQRSLSSARVISGSLSKLGAQMETFKKAAAEGGISDATDPRVRMFMMDLADPNTPMDKYAIVPDPETGELRYIDTETQGQEVSFLLDDVANGENGFAPIPKADMPGIVSGLMKGIAQSKKQIQEDWGVREVTDWDAMGEVLDSRMEELFKDNTNLKSIAAGLGFGFEEFEAAQTGQTLETRIGEDDYSISNMDDLKAALKQEMLDQVEAITPHEDNILADNRRTELDNYQAEQQAAQNKGIADVLANGDTGLIDATLTTKKEIFLGGQKAKYRGSSFDENGNLTIEGVAGTGKSASLVKKTYEMSDPSQAAQAYILMGMDPAQAIILGKGYSQL